MLRCRSAIPLETRPIHDVIMNELIQEDIMVIGSDDRVLDVKEPMPQKMGLEREDAIGRYCYEITHHQDTPCSGEADLGNLFY